MNTAIIAGNGHVETAPVNGQPTTLPEIVEHEALAYRAWQSPEGDFLAGQMDRLAQLIRLTGAATPREHLDRIEVSTPRSPNSTSTAAMPRAGKPVAANHVASPDRSGSRVIPARLPPPTQHSPFDSMEIPHEDLDRSFRRP